MNAFFSLWSYPKHTTSCLPLNLIHHHGILLDVSRSFSCSHCQLWRWKHVKAETVLCVSLARRSDSEALWTIIMYRLFTGRQANYLLHQCLSFVSESGSKAGPLLACTTCGVHREARSPLYTLCCGIIWDGRGVGKKNTLNFFYHRVALSTGLANMFALMMAECFLLLCVASAPDDPLTRLLLYDLMSV